MKKIILTLKKYFLEYGNVTCLHRKRGKWPQMNQILPHSERKLILKSTIINDSQSILVIYKDIFKKSSTVNPGQ